MKADLRISIKDYRRNKTLKIRLVRAPFPGRSFLVTMNQQPWPGRGKTVGLSRLFVALRKARVRATSQP